MPVEIITKEDLMRFKRDLLVELKEIIKEKTPEQPQWIKSPQVRKLLNISPGTLQNLRINGTLPYTKIGGVVYYSMDDIEKVMQSKKIHNK
ncbi:MAG: helix-turn-helix domain-containing protein [Cytophagales bacterium]|nr:helix-turn-helix domain-containing protein [Cytophagales bacterium]